MKIAGITGDLPAVSQGKNIYDNNTMLDISHCLDYI
jgi:hypothetical protein